jgi:hypothetical protein
MAKSAEGKPTLSGDSVTLKSGRTVSLEKAMGKVAEELLRNTAEQFIRDGTLDPSKSPNELREETLTFLLGVISQRHPWHVSVDYRQTLLQEARLYAKRGYDNLSILMYATWFEHWTNHLVLWKLEPVKGLTAKDRKEILKSVSLIAKLTWFAKLLNVSPIASNHLNTILEVSELRNGFVHYKHQPIELDSKEQEQQKARLERCIQAVEKTVRYLQALENRKMYKQKRRRIRQHSLAE